MEENAYMYMQDITYEEGDWVYVKLQPYKQTSLLNRKIRSFQEDILDHVK